MARAETLFTTRKTLDEICTVPDRIISVYSLEQHVWAESNSPEARELRAPELRTIEEFQIDPVRPFLNDIFRHMAAPYRPERRDEPVGQGYWVQAEFGSGKSHLLCFLSALALGDQKAWEIVREKEQKAGRGRRESLYRFWEDGLQAKSTREGKGIFVIVKTLVGVGGGTVGVSDKGSELTQYVLDAVKEQLQLELGKNLSLYPVELLADRFITQDLDRYRADLKKFLHDPRFFEEDEFEDVDKFLSDIQQNKSPEYKRSCGNKLWRFYTDYLKVQPQIPAESEDVLKHLVETILAQGYSGVLLVLDEISLFMKDRDEEQRVEDEKTLVVLANRLAKVHNLPIWTVCSAQQTIVSRMGVGNIIADDRLKLVKLLEEDKDYYEIVLARVREISSPEAIGNYYLHYKRGFSWPNSIGEQEFRHFFPFHKPALEVLRAITYELTTTRSAIHFMHQTLRHQIKSKGDELIRLWELFDEAVRYEEDPSGVHAGLTAIKTRRESEYRAYEDCKRQIDGLTKGYLKVHRDKGIKAIQTLFLYHIGRTRQQGITAEEIANSVLIERDADSSPDENVQHYETLAESLKKELRQIVQSYDEEGRPRYRFNPVVVGIDPNHEFQKARDEAESNDVMQREAWEHLLALDEWPIRTRQMTIDLSNGVRSMFRGIASAAGTTGTLFSSPSNDQKLEVVWHGRQVIGSVGMRDFGKVAGDGHVLPLLDTEGTDFDFAVYVGTKPASPQIVSRLLAERKDPRTMLWTPGELNLEERSRLFDFAAYRKLVATWQGKETEDAVAMVNWVASSLQADLGKIAKIVDNSYARGTIDALNNSRMDFRVAGELSSILTPLVGKVLTATYESRDVKFDHPFVFKREEGVKVINGIVKTGSIPKGAKPNQDISAAQNFGYGLKIMRKGAEKALEVSDNRYVQAIWEFIDSRMMDDTPPLKIETLYKNFMGIGGPKDYGLTRRMVQIYLLCLVKGGKVRLGLGPRSGLPYPAIDYANIADIDFSVKVLDSLTEVQKMAKPENWEVLRPYAEKILDRSISSTNDDAEISKSRADLRALFAAEKEESARVLSKATHLFDTMKTINPYEKELRQVASLFGNHMATGDDISLLLYGLKSAFGYQAFDAEHASETEVDDLGNRLKNYRDVKRFLSFETEVLAAHRYGSYLLPDLVDLREIRKMQEAVGRKLADLKPYIDSEVKLKTELIGQIPPVAGERDTLQALIGEYTSLYAAMHDSAAEGLRSCRREMHGLLNGEDFRALKLLEGISAFQPPVSASVEVRVGQLADGVFSCPSPSRSSIEKDLRSGPEHHCGLSFANVSPHLQAAGEACKQAMVLLDGTLDQKIEVFLNQAIRERLRQGQSEPAIAGILNCNELAEVRAYLVKAVLADPSVVDTINRYLKRSAIKKVKISGFRPSTSTLEKAQIGGMAKEFQHYLEDQLDSIEDDEDVLPMLQLEQGEE